MIALVVGLFIYSLVGWVAAGIAVVLWDRATKRHAKERQALVHLLVARTPAEAALLNKSIAESMPKSEDDKRRQPPKPYGL